MRAPSRQGKQACLACRHPRRFVAARGERSVALTPWRGLPPALHSELEQVSKPEILRKLKNASAARPSATFVFALADARRCQAWGVFQHAECAIVVAVSPVKVLRPRYASPELGHAKS